MFKESNFSGTYYLTILCRTVKKGCCVPFILFQWLSVLAQSEAITIADSTEKKHKQLVPTLTVDRPDQTDSPYVIPAGFFQVETGIQHQWDHYREDNIYYSYHSVTYPTILLRYGLLRNVEIRLEGNYGVEKVKKESLNIRKEDGWQPLLIATKVKLFDQKGLRPNLAILTKLFTPYHTLNQLKLTYKYTPGLVGAFSHSISDRFVLDGSVGGYVDQVSGKVVIHYSLSQAIGFTEKLSMYAEVFCTKAAGQTAQYGADTGLLFMLLPHLQLDVFASRAISYQAIDFFVGTGLGIRIPQ